MSIGNRVAIVGVGLTKFGFHPDKSYKDLVVDSCYQAFKETKMDPGEIETGWLTISMPEIVEQENIGPSVADALGIVPAGIAQIVAACAGGAVGVRAAYWAILSGLHKRVLVTGVEKISDVMGTAEAMSTSHEADFEYLYGNHSVSSFALMQSRYEQKFTVNRADLAYWSVQARWYGNRNPKAIDYRKGDITLQQVTSSPYLSSPIHGMNASKACDGSAAVILVPEKDAYLYTDTPVFIDAISFKTSPPYAAARMTYPGFEGMDLGQSWATYRAAEEAYRQAGITPQNVNFAQVHDCFPINANLQLEALGLFPEGKAPAAVAAGEAAPGGRCPTCTDGGRQSMGHPTGCTGMAMMVESVYQMREQCGERQVKNPDIAVHQTTGASNTASVVTVLSRTKH